MAASFVGRTAARRRSEMVQAASALVAEHGLSRLRMQPIADLVGVSRQTVYNEFGSKEGLVAALALDVADHLLDRAEAAVDDAPTILDAWQGALRAVLEAASAHPVLVKARDARDDGGFVRQFVVERPLIERSLDRLTPVIHRKWPEEDHRQLDVAIEAAVRLAISHFFLPLHPPAEVAAQTAGMLAGLTSARGS